MNRTEHYQLSQWDMSDRIQMEDFNADNAIIDTTLAGLERRKLETVELLDVSATLNGEKSEWRVELGDINLGNYLAVFFQVEIAKSNGAVFLQEASRPLFSLKTGKNVLYAFPMRDPDMFLAVHGFPATAAPNEGFNPLKDVHRLSLSSNVKLTGNFRMKIIAIP